LPVLLTSRLANAGTIWLIMAVVLSTRPRAAAPLLQPATDRPPVARRTAIGVAVLGGLLDIGGFVAFAIGLELAPTWIVGLASSFGPVVSVVVAVLFWGERLRPNQWLGLAGIAAGLVAVALP
jgi:drug/metabolite transporter (DMT)-like permease